MKPTPRVTTHLWPDAEQTLLLKAALHDGDAALTAFQAWQQCIDIEQHFSNNTRRLLPLVYANMQRLGLHDPLLGRLKGIYRRTWYENQQRLHALQPVIAHLAAHGVDMLLLKGVPLTLSYYRNPALRKMADLDLAVRPDQVRLAIRLLREQGWRNLYPDGPDDLRYRHALQFAGPHGDIDLHWHLLHEACNRAADEFFWTATEPLDFMTVPVRQLNPTALLFHTLIHGIRWNLEPPVRWIPDAVTILRTRGQDINWQQLFAFAAQQRMRYRLALGLDYLHAQLAIALPAAVQQQLPAIRPSLLERVENTVVLRDYDRLYRHPLGKQWVIFADYCRCAEAENTWAFMVGFSHYLRYRWGLRGRREFATVIWRGLLRRLPFRYAPTRR